MNSFVTHLFVAKTTAEGTGGDREEVRMADPQDQKGKCWGWAQKPGLRKKGCDLSQAGFDKQMFLVKPRWFCGLNFFVLC